MKKAFHGYTELGVFIDCPYNAGTDEKHIKKNSVLSALHFIDFTPGTHTETKRTLLNGEDEGNWVEVAKSADMLTLNRSALLIVSVFAYSCLYVKRG